MTSLNPQDPSAPRAATPAIARPRPRVRRRRRVLIGAALLAAAVLLLPVLLRGAARALVVSEAAPESSVLIPWRVSRAADFMAARVRDGQATGVLLIEGPPTRLEALGIIPRSTDLGRRELQQRAVAATDIAVLPGGGPTDWDDARALGRWLQAHPDAHAAVLTHRFQSRRLRLLLDRVLGPDARRAHLVPLADRGYDDATWWRRKEGLIAWYQGGLGLAYVWLAGEGQRQPAWDPDAYEGGLR